MPRPKITWLILASLVPAALALLHIWDLVNVYNNPGEYPFGSEFFSPYSIYKSKARYCIFSVASVLLLVFTIIFIFWRKWNTLCVLLVADIALFVYPIVTNE